MKRYEVEDSITASRNRVNMMSAMLAGIGSSQAGCIDEDALFEAGMLLFDEAKKLDEILKALEAERTAA